MYALSLEVNRIGKRVLELVASRRIKGRLLICTYQVLVSHKWQGRDQMNLSIATTHATLDSARYLPLSSVSGWEEILVMNWIKVIATASNTVLLYRTTIMTWHIKYSINSTKRMLEMMREIAGIVHSKSRCQSSMISTVVLNNITQTPKSQWIKSTSAIINKSNRTKLILLASKKALKCHMKWPSAYVKKSLVWNKRLPVWRSNCVKRSIFLSHRQPSASKLKNTASSWQRSLRSARPMLVTLRTG